MKKEFSIEKILKHKIAEHTYYWLIFYSVVFFPVVYFNPINFALRVASISILPLIPPVYINFYLLEKYFKKKEYVRYFLSFLALIVIGGILNQYLTDLIIWEAEGGFKTFADPVIVVIVTTGIRYYREGLRLQVQLHEAQAKQYKAELDLLKYQLNPHFFFNTLNNLFSMARKLKDKSVAEGIAKLSHLMRYILYDCNVEKINLQKEIEQINNFIKLQKLRFSEDDDIEVSFSTSGKLQNLEIIPMLLIPFVENAFKHGISLKSKSIIDINLGVENERLEFSVKNTVNKLRKNRNDEDSGIGLKNVKRRLELLYPESHELKINDHGDQFEIFLSLQI